MVMSEAKLDAALDMMRRMPPKDVSVVDPRIPDIADKLDQARRYYTLWNLCEFCADCTCVYVCTGGLLTVSHLGWAVRDCQTKSAGSADRVWWYVIGTD